VSCEAAMWRCLRLTCTAKYGILCPCRSFRAKGETSGRAELTIYTTVVNFTNAVPFFKNFSSLNHYSDTCKCRRLYVWKPMWSSWSLIMPYRLLATSGNSERNFNSTARRCGSLVYDIAPDTGIMRAYSFLSRR